MNGYTLLLALISIVHLGLVIFVFEGIRVFRPAKKWPRMYWFHRSFVILVCVIDFTIGRCPITMLQDAVRRARDPSYVPDERGFIVQIANGIGCPLTDTIMRVAMIGLAVLIFLDIRKTLRCRKVQTQ